MVDELRVRNVAEHAKNLDFQPILVTFHPSTSNFQLNHFEYIKKHPRHAYQTWQNTLGGQIPRFANTFPKLFLFRSEDTICTVNYGAALKGWKFLYVILI
jgi:hypothetical protein